MENSTPQEIVDEESATNPGARKVTVSAQTYQNYKSALKWWHRYSCPDMDKIGFS